MRKLLLAGIAIISLGLLTVGAQQVSMPPPAGTVAILCASNSSPQTIASGNVGFVQCNSNGTIIFTASPVGCTYNSTLPTVSAGGTVECQITTNGELRVQAVGRNVTGADGNTNSIMQQVRSGTDNTGSYAGAFVFNFNGSTWDRTFTCANSTPIGILPNTTNQILALSGTTIIRVCGINVTASPTGNVRFISGTGTNCGTSTAQLTGNMHLALGNSFNANASGGGSVFRGAAGHAICAVSTGGADIQGVMTYAQY